MRRPFICVCATLAFAGPAQAAGFFFFIPGGLLGKVGDAVTGASGEQCVGTSAKVGDVLTSPTGNTATIKSLSGTSSRCQRPEHPIRAAIDFNYSFSSKAGLDLPDGFEPQQVTELQRFRGMLLRATRPDQTGLVVMARPKKGVAVESIADAVSEEMSKLVDEYKVISHEQLEINGLKAARFEAQGKNKAVFGTRFNYVVTVLDGASEVVVLNAFTPSLGIDSTRETLRKLAFGVKGLGASTEGSTSQGRSMDSSVTTTKPVGTPASNVATAPNGDSSLREPSHTMTPLPGRSARPLAERMLELEDLHKRGLVTKEEFDLKRQSLLKEL